MSDGDDEPGPSITRRPPLDLGEHPAQVRPGPRAPMPPAVEPHWYDRLQGTMNVQEVLSAARAICRARNPQDDPAWPAIHDRLKLARAMCQDALNEQPHNRTAIELLNQIQRFIGPAR